MYHNHTILSREIDAKFPYTAVDPPNAIDSRHRHFLYELMMAGKFRKVLEIGTWIGYSTAAIMKSILDGAPSEVHLCDWRFQPQIHQLVRDVSAAAPRRVFLHEKRSIQVIDGSYDFIFVDGDHSWSTLVQEIHLLLRNRIRNVLFHDTNSAQLGIRNCEGPWVAKLIMTQLPERYRAWYLDEKPRPGERTDRGLLFLSSLRPQVVGPIWRQCMGVNRAKKNTGPRRSQTRESLHQG